MGDDGWVFAKRSRRLHSMLFSALSLLEITGCTQQNQTQAIDVNAISTVQAEIKRQIGVYMRASEMPTSVVINGVAVPVSGNSSNFACGLGNVSFDVSSIKAELTTTTDDSGGVKAAFTIPVHLITLGPSAGYTRDVTNTQVLDFNQWPLSKSMQDPSLFSTPVIASDLDKAPIAKVLLNLRDALVMGAMNTDYSKTPPVSRGLQPCFTDFNPAKPSADAGNTFKLGLSITNDTTYGLSIKVAVLDLSGSGEEKSVTGNTLTVSFIQSGLDQIQQAQDAVDALCKYPNATSAKCAQAKQILTNLDIKTGVGEEVRSPPA